MTEKEKQLWRDQHGPLAFACDLGPNYLTAFDSSGVTGEASRVKTPAAAIATRAALAANQNDPYLQGEIKAALHRHVAKSIGPARRSPAERLELQKNADRAFDAIEAAIRGGGLSGGGRMEKRTPDFREGDAVSHNGRVGTVLSGTDAAGKACVQFKNGSMALIRCSELEAA